jgi:polar amino acid transport system permease protein
VLWYLLITSILNVGQGAIERYYSRGDRGAQTAARRKSSMTNWEAENERA